MSTLKLVTLGLLVAAVVSDKRQGVFGPCQGWGAGCTSYSSYRPQPQPPTRKITRNVHKAPAYMFTSGEYDKNARMFINMNTAFKLLVFKAI